MTANSAYGLTDFHAAGHDLDRVGDAQRARLDAQDRGAK